MNASAESNAAANHSSDHDMQRLPEDEV